VVSIFSHHLFTDRSPKVFGYGKPTRDYIHVSDVVAALRAASGTAGTFNVGTGVETDVMTIWNILADVSDSSVEPELASLRAGELQRSCLNPAKALRELGWSAQISLNAGLRETYDALIEEFAAESVAAG
jgi:UDP-glucose 4-epimerase